VAVIRDGFTVSEMAAAFGVSRQSVHAWMARYERGGLPRGDGNRRPFVTRRCGS